jgi:OOP family OmpA-OmpF porin
MARKFIVILCFLFVCIQFSSQVIAQTLCTKNKRAIELYTDADNFRVHGRYEEAADMLRKAIEKDREFCEAYYRLALVLRAQRNFAGAKAQLEAGLAQTTDPKKQKIFYFELGDLLLLSGDYKTSLDFLDKFLKLETTNKVKIADALRARANCVYALEHFLNIPIKPVPLSDTVNFFQMQYFPVLTADEQQLFFTRRNGAADRDTEDLVVSVKDSNGRFQKPVSISPIINTPENEGTCTVSADGRQIIFTSCRGRSGFGNCDLFESHRTGNNWSEPVNLGAKINSYAWESQPSLSADGRVLFFVSDRKGGVGSRDIYRAEKDAAGNWTQAKNLGSNINTRFDEISPFIHANGRTLFFASNGYPGFGGYDVFQSAWQDSAWVAPVNFGSPVNNHEDQFSMFITADGSTAYYSHEDAGGQSNSRIYTLIIPEQLRIKRYSTSLSGLVTDAKTGLPLKAKIELIDLSSHDLVSEVYADSINGKYLMVLTRGAAYGLFVSCPGYLYKSLNFNLIEGKLEPVKIDIQLQPVQTGSAIVLRNIFFDSDRYALRPESFPELDETFLFLKSNPSVHIEISGHTDNIGQPDKNLQLSMNRAHAVVDYLIQKGIDSRRLSTKGYGASMPIAQNDTEAGRQTNRRIEFRIVK